MAKDEHIFGIFIMHPSTSWESSPETKASAVKDGVLGEKFICDPNGIFAKIKNLKAKDYGLDIELVLFKIIFKPIPYLLANLKEIESYRKKERAIGIPIVLNDENFFLLSDNEKNVNLKNIIFKKIDLLEVIVKRRKLDTNIGLLKLDLEKVLN